MAFGRSLTAQAVAQRWLTQALGESPATETVSLADGVGRIAAATVVAEKPYPATASAAYDGFAVQSVQTLGAGLYAPIRLPLADNSARAVAAGEPFPSPYDAVVETTAVTVEPDAVTLTQSVAAGDGWRAAGHELSAADVVVRRGQHIDASARCRLGALGVDTVSCRAMPRVALIAAGRHGRHDGDLTGPLLAGCLREDGLEPLPVVDGLDEGIEAIGGCDTSLAVIYGGSGWGAQDRVAETLARHGELAIRGLAIRPGESAQLARIGSTVVVVLPGAPWPCRAAYRLVVRGPLRAWLGRVESRAPPIRLRLARKITSTLGLTELVPVAIEGDEARPLPRGVMLPPAAMDGVVVVDEGSEGFPAGEAVPVVWHDEVSRP